MDIKKITLLLEALLMGMEVKMGGKVYILDASNKIFVKCFKTYPQDTAGETEAWLEAFHFTDDIQI